MFILCGRKVISVENHLLNTCRRTAGEFYRDENHSLTNVWLLGVVKKPLSESDDTREKDQALPDDIPEGNDSSSGEEEYGNAMTEEVKITN